MSEWKEYKIGEVATFSYGKMPKKSLLNTGAFPTFSGYKYQYKYPEYNCEKGDIIVVARGVGGTGDVKIVKERCYLTNLSIKIELDKEQVDNTFFYYFFMIKTLRYLDSGSAQSQITIKDLENEIYTFPSIEEQKATASVLGSLDDKIDLLHRQNKTLEAMAETLFREWFVERAQEDWEWHQLDDYIEVMRGLSYKGAGLTDEHKGVPMHNLNSVYEGGEYKYEGIKYYSGDYKERHLVFPGDVIVTNTEQGHEMLLIGCPAIVPNYFGELGIFSQHIYKLKILENAFTETFLYFLIKSYDVREQIIGATNGSTVNMLKKDGIEWVKFKMPPNDLILNFTKIAKPLLTKKEENHVQIRTLENLRDTLLPKLMSGAIQIKE